MRRTGLGRRSRLQDDTGDPLDGLVNLFDLGIVLAAAFLVAGLGLTTSRENREAGGAAGVTTPALPERRTPLIEPAAPSRASGQGDAVGTVYRLADGRLVLVRPGGAASTPP